MIKQNRWVIGITCLLAALIILTGCVPAANKAAPQETKQVVAVPPDNPGAVAALDKLKEEFKAGSSLSSQDSAGLTQQRQDIVDKLNEITGQVQVGEYEEALKSLETGFVNKASVLVINTYSEKVASAVSAAVEAIKVASRTTVSTKYGRLAGASGRGVSHVWKGIPYAAPPVGQLRWRAPQAPVAWTGVRHSSNTYSMATQMVVGKTWIATGAIGGSEDCLYLNVWRPQNEDKNLPVYFWIHGGGNNFGSAQLYDGAALARLLNVVVVVIQYRLGPLGWFTHPALREGVSPEEASGNFGTLDTIHALKWVKENISAFGGNPDNVTIAGQSAGGHNVMNLLITPLASGLFHRAVGQSGAMQIQAVAKGEEMANLTIEKLLVSDGKAADAAAAGKYRESMTNADIARYLRGKSAEELSRAQTNNRGYMDFHPAYEDGTVIPGALQVMIESGNYNRVPIILGSNYDEMKNFLPLFGAMIPTSNGHRWFDLYKVLDGQVKLEEVMPLDLDKDLYNACGYYSSRNFKARFVDSNARRLKEKQDNVYAYLFKWGGAGSGPSPYDFIFGAAHAVEIPFFFGLPRDSFGYAFTDENKPGREQLQKAMMSYLKQFMLTGNPNLPGNGLPTWEPWSNNEGAVKSIIFDATFNEVKISMMTEEVTVEGVKSKVSGLAEPTRAMVKLWLQ